MISTPGPCCRAEPQRAVAPIRSFRDHIAQGAIGIRPRGWWIASWGRVFSMSDAKHEGHIGPNDPEYYAPRELRERASRRAAEPGAHAERWVASANADGRTVLATIWQASTPPGFRNVHQGRRAGHAGGEGRGAGRSAVRAPRPVGSARAAPAGHPLLDRGGDCGEHRDASRHGHSVFATPRRARTTRRFRPPGSR